MLRLKVIKREKTTLETHSIVDYNFISFIEMHSFTIDHVINNYLYKLPYNLPLQSNKNLITEIQYKEKKIIIIYEFNLSFPVINCRTAAKLIPTTLWNTSF